MECFPLRTSEKHEAEKDDDEGDRNLAAGGFAGRIGLKEAEEKEK